MQVNMLGQHFIQAKDVQSGAIILNHNSQAQTRQQASTSTAAYSSGWSYPKQVSMYREASNSKQSTSTFTASRSVGSRQARQRSQAPRCTASTSASSTLRPYHADACLNTPARPQPPRINTQASSVQKAAQCILTVSALARERCSNHAGLIPCWQPRSDIPDV